MNPAQADHINARFSTHPSVVERGVKTHDYGHVYHKAAKDLLGSMLGVPSRKTVMALVLLAHLGFAVGESRNPCH